MINKIAKLFVKKKPTLLEKAKSTATSYGSKAKAKGMDAFGKMQQSKLYKDASNSIGEMSSKVSKLSNKAYKHIEKHPKKYAAGAAAVAGAGVYSQHKKHKKDGTHSRLKKELQRKGYV